MYTYKLGGMLITDELYHDDLEAMTFGRKDQNELMHYGIKGQSWGKRRFQNEDGSLTAAGRNRYDVGDPKQGVTAYSDTGGRGGSGVSYTRLPSVSGGANRATTGSATSVRRPSSVASSVRPGVSQQMRNQTANKVANIQQRVVNSTNNGRKAADNLFSRIGNWASNAANDVGKAATNAYNGASRAVNDAANWVGDRAKDVGNAASNAYNDASKAVTNAANDVGNAVKNVAQDVSDWYTGDKVGREAQRYDNVVQNFERAGDANVNAGQDIISRGLKYPESAYDLESGQSMRDKTVIEGLDRRNLGYDQHDIARQYGQKADEAQAKYEAAPRQVINSVAENIGNTANDAANWVGDRAKDVGNFATNAANAAGNAIGNAAKDVGNFATNAANAAGNTIGNAARDVGDWASNAASDVRDWGAGALDKGRQAFENLFGRSEPTVNEKLDPTPKTFTENVIEEQRIPEQRITEDRIEEQRIPEAIIREGEKYRQMTPDQRQAHMDSQKNRPTVSGSNNVQTWDNGNINTWDNVKTFGDPDMVNTIKMLNDNGFFNRESSSNSGNSSSMSDKPSNVSDEFWREYTFNGGTREQYDAEMQRMRNQNANRQQSSNDMSDKPSNVSDEFWREYTFNGGTRDSYDREMNARKNSQNNQNSGASRQDVVGTVDTSRPYHFTYDPASGQTIVVYDDEKRR